MVGPVRRSGLALALPAIVGLSTLLHWLAGRRIAGLWIMPDEAIYGTRALALWQHGTLAVLHGEGAGYGLLYPMVAGVPLSVGDFARGYASLKLLQALVVSLAAVPVFFYGRRLMPGSYALIAAALTVASPLLLYSGLIMTEVLFYPLAALALLSIARAIETATPRDQGIALLLIGVATATRVQAVICVGVFAVAIVVDAIFARSPSRLRSFWPVWALLALTLLATAVAPGLFGAYAATLSGGYPVTSSLRFAYYHLACALLMVAVIPVAATALLAIEAARGRERDPGARALIAVTLTSLVLVAGQVGLFAARYAPHLLSRDLAPLPPLCFLAFGLWLGRGAPAGLRTAAAVILALLAIVVFAPWNTLVTDIALPDTFDISTLYRSPLGAPANVAAIGAAVLLALIVVLPRRLRLVLPAAVLATLILSSVLASNLITAQANASQAELVGSPRRWVDANATGNATYVYTGDSTWNVAWEQRFWNQKITRAVSLAPSLIPGPMHQAVVSLGPDGRVPITTPFAVSSTRVAMVGTPVARQSLGPDQHQLVLWRLDDPARVSLVTQDIKPNGDMEGPAQITAYDCGGGSLRLTLLPKTTDVLEIDLDGRTVLRQHIAGLPSWHRTIPVPPSARPRSCAFSIRGGTLLGSTVIEFDRPG